MINSLNHSHIIETVIAIFLGTLDIKVKFMWMISMALLHNPALIIKQYLFKLCYMHQDDYQRKLSILRKL